jgi:ATP-dependent RNA helicase DeaD
MAFTTAHPALRQALDARGYQLPTSVQQAVLDSEPGRDLLVSAQTGSGKTVAFGLAIAATLLGDSDQLPPPNRPLALAIAPTRELAMQVRDELAWLYAQTGARVVACVGGMDPRRERQMLDAGCHIVVGTPGRLRDHLERHQLDVSALQAVILDEADEMLDLGFREDLEFILQTTPATRRTLLFSATIPRGIAALAQTYQRNALRLDTARRNEPHGDIDYRAIRIGGGEIERATINVLRYHAAPSALVFCATREAVRHMHAGLVERGFAAVALSGELSQTERTRALSAVRDGRAQVCVATDVAARGLDLPALDLVIHADLPGSREALLHRSGRTGRAGRKGVCVVLVPNAKQRRAQTLFATAGIAVQWEPAPTLEQIRARDDQKLLDDPRLAEPPGADELALAARMLADRPAEQAVAVLLRLLRAHQPAAEELQPQPEVRAERGANPRANTKPGPKTRAEFGEDAVRFRVPLGRRHKADPKWLLPLICRVGGVSRKEIGRIEVNERESLFEVAGDAVADFRTAILEPSTENVQIEEVGAPPRRPKKKTWK